ncbi:hypothetical protein V0288_23790 [Pannus brasiliensis CCIBt3594]|uniref:HTH cro/C1-type domain-containing protein n=1 Tax=Pannus brasiliensis CCIBt3594 TaxID=1427578 RepID=A0AAW9QSW9_9CHRO
MVVQTCPDIGTTPDRSLDPKIFNRIFAKTVKNRGLQGKQIAEWTGRTPNSISRIRTGEDSPRLCDFVEILSAIEAKDPGFFEAFCRELSGQSRRMTISPEEFVNSLDSSEFAALMMAAAIRLSQSEAARRAS